MVPKCTLHAQAAEGWSLCLTFSLELFPPTALRFLSARPIPPSKTLGSPPSSEGPTRRNRAQKQVTV